MAPRGSVPASVSLIGDNLTWTYRITVPAGQTIRLASFTIQSMSRAAAIAEANALVTTAGLGGEAGLFLTPAESGSWLNFNFGVLSVTSTSIDSGVLTPGNSSITVTFNKPVLGSGTAANYRLQSAGADGLLGTADDTTIALVSITAGNPATLNFGSLPPGIYRLTIFGTITDMLGNPLDGDGDGQPGGNFSRDFVVSPQPGSSLFGAATTYAAGSGPTCTAVGDFNHDGKLDIAVADTSGGNVAVFLGDGRGGFGPATTFSSGGSDPEGVVVGDFNGDGNLDLATTNWPSGTIGILLGSGSGGFTTTTVSSGGNWPDAIAVGDFNHDGKLDLAVANGNSNTVSILLGNGNGTFSAPATYSTGGSWPQGIAVGDFNGDGNLDVVVSNFGSGNVGVLLGNGDGTFGPATTYSTGGTWPMGMAVGDFNGDGKLDLAVANQSSGTVGVLLGNGKGGFSAATTSSTGGTTANQVAIGDFNKDGIPDLVVTNGGSGTVGLLLGNGDGTFAPVTTYSSGGSGTYWVAVADFNGDGSSDLAVGNQSSNTVGVMFRRFTPAVLPLVSPGGYNFDVQYGGYGSGQLVQGTANAFDGMGRLQVGGADYAPPVAAVSLANNGQTVVLPSQTMAGLTVSRAVSVPDRRRPGLRPHRR